jgi:hypothetical protein
VGMNSSLSFDQSGSMLPFLSDDDFDVLADGAVVGSIFKPDAAPEGPPRLWTLGRSCLTGQGFAA